MKKKEEKSSENDQLTGHFQSFFSFHFQRFFLFCFFKYLQKKTVKQVFSKPTFCINSLNPA